MQVTVFTKPYCPACQRMKGALTREGIAFEENNIEPGVLQFFREQGFRSAPVVRVEHGDDVQYFAGDDPQRVIDTVKGAA